MGLSFPGTGAQIDKLWENKNPEAVDSGKIDLDLSTYDAVLVTVVHSVGRPVTHSTGIVVKDKMYHGVMSISNTEPGYITGRLFYVWDDKLEYMNGYFVNAASTGIYSTSAPDCCVPVAVYGIRF